MFGDRSNAVSSASASAYFSKKRAYRPLPQAASRMRLQPPTSNAPGRRRKRRSTASVAYAFGSDRGSPKPPMIKRPLDEQGHQGEGGDPRPGLTHRAARRAGGEALGADLDGVARLDVAFVGVEQVHRE